MILKNKKAEMEQLIKLLLWIFILVVLMVGIRFLIKALFGSI